MNLSGGQSLIIRYTALSIYHRIITNKTSVGEQEIKREEKYFVFIWMSRKEQVIGEKMAHSPTFYLKKVITLSLHCSWSETMHGKIKKNGRPKK